MHLTKPPTATQPTNADRASVTAVSTADLTRRLGDGTYAPGNPLRAAAMDELHTRAMFCSENRPRRARRAKAPMTKLDPSRTVRLRNFREQLEIWAAFSADGRWSYGKEEMPGTPWIAKNEQTSETSWFGTLAGARRWTYRQDNENTNGQPKSA